MPIVVASWVSQLNDVGANRPKILGPLVKEVDDLYLGLACFVSAVKENEWKFQDGFEASSDWDFSVQSQTLHILVGKYRELTNQDVAGIIERAKPVD